MASRRGNTPRQPGKQGGRRPSAKDDHGYLQLLLAAVGTTADVLAISFLFVTGYAGVGTAVLLLNIWFAAWLVLRGRISAQRGALTVAVIVLTATLGGILGYLWGPAIAPTASRDADLQGYCLALGVVGFKVRDPTVPRSPEGRFFCNGIAKPVNMESACRWKWGPQERPPTLANESDAFTWRCHPRFR